MSGCSYLLGSPSAWDKQQPFVDPDRILEAVVLDQVHSPALFQLSFPRKSPEMRNVASYIHHIILQLNDSSLLHPQSTPLDPIHFISRSESNFTSPDMLFIESVIKDSHSKNPFQHRDPMTHAHPSPRCASPSSSSSWANPSNLINPTARQPQLQAGLHPPSLPPIETLHPLT